MLEKQLNFRTDLASERRDIYRKANSLENEIDGIESEKEEINEKISVERVKITTRRRSNWKANWKLYNNWYKKIKNSSRWRYWEFCRNII